MPSFSECNQGWGLKEYKMNRDEAKCSILKALKETGLATTAVFCEGRAFAEGIYPETKDLRVDLSLDANHRVRFAIVSMAPRQDERIMSKQDDPNLVLDRQLLASEDQIQQDVQSAVSGADVHENWGEGMTFRIVLDVVCPSSILWDRLTTQDLQTITKVCRATIAALNGFVKRT